MYSHNCRPVCGFPAAVTEGYPAGTPQSGGQEPGVSRESGVGRVPQEGACPMDSGTQLDLAVEDCLQSGHSPHPSETQQASQMADSRW